jgi:hypothetical protein
MKMHSAIQLSLASLGAGFGLWLVALGCDTGGSTVVPERFAGYNKGVTLPEKLPFKGCSKLPIIIGRSEFRGREVRELLKECFHDHGNYPELMLPWPEYDPGTQPDCDQPSSWCLNQFVFPTDKDIVLRGVDEELLLLRVQRSDTKVTLYNQRKPMPLAFFTTYDAQYIADWNLLIMTIEALEDNREAVERIASEVAAEREATKHHLGLGEGSHEAAEAK